MTVGNELAIVKDTRVTNITDKYYIIHQKGAGAHLQSDDTPRKTEQMVQSRYTSPPTSFKKQ
jgi:hypothetical protein